MTTRSELKAACLAILDEQAIEHPLGHQGVHAVRYLLRCDGGDRAELMFEKGDRTPANLWVAERRIHAFATSAGIPFRQSPASSLFVRTDAKGRAVYGRHAALRPMRELAHADLLCFCIEDAGQLTAILTHLAESAEM